MGLGAAATGTTAAGTMGVITVGAAGGGATRGVGAEMEELCCVDARSGH